MMNLSKIFTLLILGAFVAGSSYAAVVTVPGNAATINGALELLDYNDGEADTVLIGPGVYDEQVAPKANAGADSVAFPTAGGLSTALMQQAIGSHTDPLTLRGSDPNDPPIITLIGATPAPYGVFPGNPSDFFFSIFVYCSKDITMDNINLQYGPTQDYAKNGMASNFVWQDCLFTTAAMPGEDFCDYNNNRDILSDTDPLIGLDNEYVYSNCIMDGSSVVDGQRFDSAFVWWHGYGNTTPGGNAVGDGVFFDNCVVRNWADIVHNFRSNALTGTRGAPNGLHASDCYFQSAGNTFNINGAMADSEIVRCVFNFGDQPGRCFEVTTREGAPNRRGIISDIVFANNLVVGAKGGQCINVDHSDQVNVGSTPSLHIVNNTFYDYNANATPRVNIVGQETDVLTLNIANNIFAATTVAPVAVTAVSVVPTNAAAIVGNISNNLFFNNTTDVNNTSNAVVAGSVVGNPAFNGTTVNIPATPPSDLDSRLQQFVPTALAVNAGSNARYAAAPANAGSVDVDSLNQRIGGASIDIGAQESDGIILVTGWDMY